MRPKKRKVSQKKKYKKTAVFSQKIGFWDSRLIPMFIYC